MPMQSISPIAKRNTGLDALRGVAVLLMVQQHLGAWLWNEPWNNVQNLIKNHAFMMGLNGLGGFAAPLFITIAGMSAQLYIARNNQGNKAFQISNIKFPIPNGILTLALRGLIIIAFGYMLNIAIPSWFSPASWYVLHMIGFGIFVSPLLRRLKPWQLLILSLLFLAATLAIRSSLDTPLAISNKRMADYTMQGGVWRLIIAEGHFSIFPWTAAFIWGAMSASWLHKQQQKRIIYFSITCALAGALLALAPSAGTNDIARRLMRFSTNMYTIPLSLFFLLNAASLLCIALFSSSKMQSLFSETNVLVCLGRSSLTILIVHVAIFRQAAIAASMFKLLNTAQTLGAIAAILIAFSLLARLWQKAGYKYGAEWVLRKLAG